MWRQLDRLELTGGRLDVHLLHGSLLEPCTNTPLCLALLLFNGIALCFSTCLEFFFVLGAFLDAPHMQLHYARTSAFLGTILE